MYLDRPHVKLIENVISATIPFHCILRSLAGANTSTTLPDGTSRLRNPRRDGFKLWKKTDGADVAAAPAAPERDSHPVAMQIKIN